MAGRIVVTEYISLDGVIEDPVGMENSGLGDWVGPFHRGPEGDRFKLDELMAASAILLGRKTYDAFAAHWPQAKDAYADRINALPKYVVSHHEPADWSDTRVISSNLSGAAAKLKTERDGDILVYGSASIVHQLAPVGLIDEYRLMIYPTVLGRGKKMLPDGYAAVFKTEEVRQFGDGIVLIRYRGT
jgi:dihydrofolate reductase